MSKILRNSRTLMLILLLCISLLVCPMLACKDNDDDNVSPGNSPVTYISFESWDSEYTEEQHILNIESRAEELLNNEYGDMIADPQYKIKSYKVYLLYSFDNIPRYFLVEWFSIGNSYEFSNVGFIYQDEYYFYEAKSDNLFLNTIDNKTVYRKEDVLHLKKYFSSSCSAYLSGEDIICLSNAPDNSPDIGEVMSKEQIDSSIDKNYYLTYNVMLKFKTQK